MKFFFNDIHKTAFFRAAENGYFEIVKLFLNHPKLDLNEQMISFQ